MIVCSASLPQIEPNRKPSKVYLMGNPLVVWLVLLAVLYFAVARLISFTQVKKAQTEGVTENLTISVGPVKIPYGSVQHSLTVGTYCFICYWLNVLPVSVHPQTHTRGVDGSPPAVVCLARRYTLHTHSHKQGRSCCVCLYFDGFVCMCVCVQYVAVSRAAFCYHYLPGLLYGELLVAIVLDGLTDVFAPKQKVLVCSVVIAIAAYGTWYFAPWIYALPIPAHGENPSAHPHPVGWCGILVCVCVCVFCGCRRA